MQTPVLTVVMPVYNEGPVIAEVLRSWLERLGGLGVDFRIRVYDDGSRDETPEIVGALVRQDPRVVLIRQANRGHGPTLLRAYGEALGDWVFQIDSDGEMPASGFASLWERREEHDFLVGYRQGRRASVPRRLVTSVAVMTVRALFGAGLRDVNSPYRLMRGRCLSALLPELPADAFAPNVLLSGLALRRGLRVYEAPVEHEPRRWGRGSLTSARLWKGALRSFVQTLRVAFQARRERAP